MRLCPRCPTSPADRVGKVARGQRAIHPLRQATLPTLVWGILSRTLCVTPLYFSILWSSFFVRPEGRFSVPTCLGPVTSRADAVKDGRRTDAATRSAFEGHP